MMRSTASKQHESVGILGYGEVGQAITKFYHHPKIKDLTKDDGLKGKEIKAFLL